MPARPDSPVERELDYHEKFYSSSLAREHFSKPAVRAFRKKLVAHILRCTGAQSTTRVLSLGCGLGDTELLLASRVSFVLGVDGSAAAIHQAEQDRARLGVRNATFQQLRLGRDPLPEAEFDLVLAIFLLHHLPLPELNQAIRAAHRALRSEGTLYTLDPSRYRLTGAIGKLLVPQLMERYRSPEERELDPSWLLELVREAGFRARLQFFDFLSTPLAGLMPSQAWLYEASWWLDRVLIRLPGIRWLGSNFEIIARKA